MATSNMKFSLVLEAVTQAFNTAMKQAGANYSQVTSGIARDSANMSQATAKVGADLSKVFQAKDAAATTAALKSVTAELNNTAKGAVIAASDMRKIGQASKQSVAELTGALQTARAELRQLQAAKAAPEDLKVAQDRVRVLRTEIAAAQAAYGRFQTAAATAMRRAAAETEQTTSKAREAANAIYATLNVRSNGSLRAEIAAINAQLTSFKTNSGAPAAEVNRVTAAARQRIAELRGELSGINSAATSGAGGVSLLGSRLLAAAGATVGLAAVQQGLKAITDAAIQLDQVMKQLEFGTGSAERAREEYAFLQRTAKELGLDLATLGRDYAQLTAATKGTNLEGEATRTLFIGISQAAATLGLSADNTSGVITALSQIASKGKVSMEELRQQLGERLPGAFALAARSMGVTTGELEELVDKGLDATTFLKAFGPALQQTFSAAAANNVNTLQGKINLLRNEFRELQLDLVNGGLGGGLKSVFDTLTSAVERVRAALRSLDPATVAAIEQAISQLFGVVTNVVGTVVSAVGDLFSQLNSLVGAVTGVVGAFVGIDTVSSDVDFLTRTLQGVSVVLGVINDGISGIGIAFTLTTGVAQKFFASIVEGLAAVTFGDLSDDLKRLAVSLEADSAASFKKAEDAALNFKSKAVEALDATTTAAKQTGATVATDIGAGAQKAGADLKTMGADAQTAAGIIKLESVAGGEAVLGIAKAGREATEAIRELAAQAGVQLPASARSVEQLGAALAEVAVKSQAVAGVIATELPEAISKLNGPQLEQFRKAFVGGLQQAGASVDQLNQATVAFAAQGAKSLGVDLTASLKVPSQGFEQMRGTLQNLVGDMDNLRRAGVDANKLVADSLEGMLAKARNPAEVQQLIEMWRKLGEQGKVTGDALKQGLDGAKAKLDELTPGVNSLAEAYKTLGLQAGAEASKIAKDYEKAFFMIETSGKASLKEVQQAFITYANAAIQANGGVASEWIQAKAAVLGLEVAVDSAGQATVRAMSAGADATKGLVSGINQATQAAKEYVGWAERMAKRNSEVKSTLQTDSEGFAADAKGNRIVAGGELTTLTGIKNFLMQAGLEEAIAKRVALEFSDGKGNIPYFSNAGQTKYGGRSSTMSEALLKAAERYTFGTGGAVGGAAVGAPQRSSPGSGNTSAYDSGDGGSKSVIEFVGVGGKSVSATVKGTNGTADMLQILKDAGASASVR